jgi:phenylalanyl-tRNA synthetase alpha chain
MFMTSWTSIQQKRLKELNAGEEQLEKSFGTPSERDRAYQELEKSLVQAGKKHLEELRTIHRRPALCRLEEKLIHALTQEGFVQVVTPIILAKGLLAKMSITDDHPLASQVFWIGDNKCLRPMLAPNLYFLLKDLLRLWKKPVRIFEVGPCFRKESQGAQHLNEFTMLNLVEMGLREEEREEHMKVFADLIMEEAGIRPYEMRTTSSEVYGTTVDILVEGYDLELGSGAMGPHSLDKAWGIVDLWVGIGFGLERLLMVKEGRRNIKSVARGLTYLDGVRLNIE